MTRASLGCQLLGVEGDERALGNFLTSIALNHAGDLRFCSRLLDFVHKDCWGKEQREDTALPQSQS